MRWIIVLLAFAPVGAIGGEIELSWTPPTQNTDGSPLTDLDGYKVYYGTASGSYTNEVDIADATLTRFAVTDLADGVEYFFVMTAHNTAGVESDFSSETSGIPVTEPTVPMPPTNLTVVEDNLTAYAILESENRVTLMPVGEAVARVPCDGTQPIMGMYVIDREDVLFYGDVKPLVVVAQCSG